MKKSVKIEQFSFVEKILKKGGKMRKKREEREKIQKG
jgi:hypothetical protein